MDRPVTTLPYVLVHLLRQALVAYGRHLNDCTHYTTGECDCGLEEARML